MKPRFPAIAGQMDVPGNDSKHNKLDLNRGGGTRAMQKRIPPAQRGGTGHNGRDITPRASMSGGRSGSGNPASRGGSVGSFTPEARISGHGGSPQERGGAGTGTGFGDSGQRGVPTGRASNPQPGSGNTGGTTYRMIAGRFKRSAMGARASQGSTGNWGGSPVTQNT
jgi:hypothetical protein